MTDHMLAARSQQLSSGPLKLVGFDLDINKLDLSILLL